MRSVDRSEVLVLCVATLLVVAGAGGARHKRFRELRRRPRRGPRPRRPPRAAISTRFWTWPTKTWGSFPKSTWRTPPPRSRWTPPSRASWGRTSTVGHSPAAVFVITNEMIRRSAARSIPEVLRMAPGVEVAQIDSNKWAVSIRGFSGRFTNDLLVLIDGRIVYDPLFSGVFWDVQDVPCWRTWSGSRWSAAPGAPSGAPTRSTASSTSSPRAPRTPRASISRAAPARTSRASPRPATAARSARTSPTASTASGST